MVIMAKTDDTGEASSSSSMSKGPPSRTINMQVIDEEERQQRLNASVSRNRCVRYVLPSEKNLAY